MPSPTGVAGSSVWSPTRRAAVPDTGSSSTTGRSSWPGGDRRNRVARSVRTERVGTPAGLADRARRRAARAAHRRPRPSHLHGLPPGARTDGSPSSVGPSGVTTFCYSLPMRDGWLVEETVLAARPAVEPIALLPRLAARLGRHPDSLLADAVRTEYVRIPLGGARPGPDQPIVAFGAAAGYVHAATGFSVAASIRAAPTCRRSDRSSAHVVGGRRRSRTDRRCGVVGCRCGAPGSCTTTASRSCSTSTTTRCASFFDTFFDLPVDDWTAYLRVDTPPQEVSAVMARCSGRRAGSYDVAWQVGIRRR